MGDDESKLNVAKFYDELAENWDKTRPRYTREVFNRIASALDENKRFEILDFGCGTGLLCRFLHERLPKAKIDGVDISPGMIEKARSNCPACRFFTGDLSSLTGRSYDVVVSKDVVNHLDDVPKTLRRLCQLLKPVGTLIIANRERERRTEATISALLDSLGYMVSTEWHTFKPEDHEVEAFLETLSLSERHKEIVRQRLRASGDYYIVYARLGAV